jgi:PTH1 family peptidyl-tRNA hydrolase
MRAILGLGNPGHEYDRTRHNCGFLVTEQVAAFCQVKLAKRCFHLYRIGKITKNEESIVLIQPLTYMNNSGEIIKEIDGFEKEKMIVICDQMDLPVGSIRIKIGGGDAGHNGLKSIINNLEGYKGFTRVYVGIGRPKQNESVVDHVLGIEEDEVAFKEGIDRASDAIIDIINGKDIPSLMQKYNKKVTSIHLEDT